MYSLLGFCPFGNKFLFIQKKKKKKKVPGARELKQMVNLNKGAYGVQRFLQSVPGAGGKFFSSETESDLLLDTRCVMVLGHSYGMISGTSWAPSYLALEIGLYMILLSIGTLM